MKKLFLFIILVVFAVGGVFVNVVSAQTNTGTVFSPPSPPTSYNPSSAFVFTSPLAGQSFRIGNELPIGWRWQGGVPSDVFSIAVSLRGYSHTSDRYTYAKEFEEDHDRYFTSGGDELSGASERDTFLFSWVIDPEDDIPGHLLGGVYYVNVTVRSRAVGASDRVSYYVSGPFEILPSPYAYVMPVSTPVRGTLNTVVAPTPVATPAFSMSLSLAPTVVSQTVQPGQRDVSLLGFSVRPSGGNVGVTTVFVRATSTIGILDAGDVQNLRLYDSSNVPMVLEAGSFNYYSRPGTPGRNGFNVSFIAPSGVGRQMYELVRLGETKTFVLKGDIGVSAASGDSYTFSVAQAAAVTGGMDMTNAGNFIDAPKSYESIPNANADVQIRVVRAPTCREDVNRDGTVNIIDLVLISRRFGVRVDVGLSDDDVNSDGIINIIDLVMVGRKFGQRCPDAGAYISPTEERVVFVPVPVVRQSQNAGFASVLKSIFWVIGN